MKRSEGRKKLRQFGSTPTERLNINVIAVLRRKPNGNFELVARWVLRTEHSDPQAELPLADDVFGVQIRRPDGRVLDSLTGQFLPADQATPFAVKPRKWAMLDPPRILEPAAIDSPANPSAQDRFWRVAQMPTGPGDITVTNTALKDGPASAAAGKDVTLPFLVGNLLCGTNRFFNALTFAGTLYEKMQAQVDALAAEKGDQSPFADIAAEQIHDSACLAANHAVWELPAGADPVSELRSVATEFAHRLRTRARKSDPISARSQKWKLDGADDERTLKLLSLLLRTFAQPEIQQAHDTQTQEPDRARRQLFLKALQGGNLIDFWCSPDNRSEICQGGRGKQHAGADLMGLGLTVGDWAKAEVQSWISAGGYVDVVVTGPDSQNLPELFTPGRGVLGRRFPLKGIDLALLAKCGGNAERQYAQGTRRIEEEALKRAIDPGIGTSLPPEPPDSARINYALLHKNPRAPFATKDTSPAAPEYGFTTGESMVEVVIEMAKSHHLYDSAYNDRFSPVCAYNIYCVKITDLANNDPLRKCVDEPKRVPRIDWLRPWLVTRRYSYRRDLKAPFPASESDLDRILESPPWMPVMIRSSEAKTDSISSIAPESPPAPNVRPENLASFIFDVRRGRKSRRSTGFAGPRKHGWDPEDPVDSNWLVEAQQGNDLSALAFWVTAVDPFEQESAPARVNTNDVDANEAVSYIFAPRRRAPLLAPQADEIKFEKVGTGLVASWKAPPRNRMSIPSAAAYQGREDPATLASNIVVFRRKLRHKIEQSGRPSIFTTVDPVFSAPPWDTFIANMAMDDWSAWRTVANSVKWDWSSGALANEELLGYEFAFAVSLLVTSSTHEHWIENTPIRTVWTAKYDGKAWVRVEERVPEMPRSSAVALSKSQAVPDFRIPNGIDSVHIVSDEAGKEVFYAAKPILPPPGLDRDLILRRILSWPCNSPGNINKTLTRGQEDMLDAAFERWVESGVPAHVDKAKRIVEDELAQAKMHREVENVGPPRAFRLVGFRGVLPIEIDYTPQRRDFSEATRFRILETSIALDGVVQSWAMALDRCIVHTRRGGRGSVASSGSYGHNVILDLPTAKTTQLKGLTDLLGYAGARAGRKQDRSGRLSRIVAAEIRIRANDGTVTSWFGTALALTSKGRTAKTSLEIRLDMAPIRRDVHGRTTPANDRLPRGDCDVRLYPARRLADIDNEGFGKPVVEMMTGLPVGGGHSEVLMWWVLAVSAEDRECDASAAKCVSRYFPITIAPEPPRGLYIRPQGCGPSDWIDPKKYDAYLPNTIRSEEDAQNANRLVLEWDESSIDPDPRIYVIIHKEWSTDLPAAVLAPKDLRAWDALQFVATKPDPARLPDEVLDNLRQWMRGKIIDLPDGSSLADKDARYTLLPRSPATMLSRDPRLVSAPNPGSHAKFVDYFNALGHRSIDDPEIREMDGTRHYRYRLLATVDLGASVPDPNFRYLDSRPSEWSPWMGPVPCPITVLPKPLPASRRYDVRPPSVIFRVALDGTRSADRGSSWIYRVTIQRRLAAILDIGGARSAIHWRDIGQPVEIARSDQKMPTAIIVDRELERAFLDKNQTWNYRAHVTLVRRFGHEGDGMEYLVRAADPVLFDVTLPALPNPDFNDLEKWPEFDIEVPIWIR